MKTIHFILISVIIYSSPIIPQSWECEDCPKRDLAIFDLDIFQREPPEPGSGLDEADWLEMFMVAGGILDAFFNEDPSSDCLNFFDGQMVTIIEWGEDNANFGWLGDGYHRRRVLGKRVSSSRMAGRIFQGGHHPGRTDVCFGLWRPQQADGRKSE